MARSFTVAFPVQENMRHTTEHTDPAPLNRFAKRLLVEWRKLELPQSNARVVVGVSGGADSVALLLALNELIKAKLLQIEITLAHFNHNLRGRESDRDAHAVVRLANEIKAEVVVESQNTTERAQSARDNLEQSARRARYDFFAGVAAAKNAGVVCVAHTLDDQAETVLLRLMRGSGANGLSAMRPVRELNKSSADEGIVDSSSIKIMLARPFLNWARRADTENYCGDCGVGFRMDAMNNDETFARVFVRKKILPLMRELNPGITETLARTAKVLRADAETLDNLATTVLANAAREAQRKHKVRREDKLNAANDTTHNTTSEMTHDNLLAVDVLRAAPLAIRRRAVRLWLAECRGDLRKLEAAHLAGIERLLEGERGGRIAQLPGGAFVVRRKGLLVFETYA